MEEDGITGLERTLDPLQAPECRLHALGVGTGLIADRSMIEPSEAVRARENLKASIIVSRPIDGNHATGQIGEQAAGLIPVAVILVPLPGAADSGSLRIIL